MKLSSENKLQAIRQDIMEASQLASLRRKWMPSSRSPSMIFRSQSCSESAGSGTGVVKMLSIFKSFTLTCFEAFGAQFQRLEAFKSRCMPICMSRRDAKALSLVHGELAPFGVLRAIGHAVEGQAARREFIAIVRKRVSGRTSGLENGLRALKILKALKTIEQCRLQDIANRYK